VRSPCANDELDLRAQVIARRGRRGRALGRRVARGLHRAGRLCARGKNENRPKPGRSKASPATSAPAQLRCESLE